MTAHCLLERDSEERVETAPPAGSGRAAVLEQTVEESFAPPSNPRVTPDEIRTGAPARMAATNNGRRRALVIPREHGAWGMLLIPLATGAVAALHSSVNGGALVLLMVAAMSLFWLRTPVESWWGASPIKVQTKAERDMVMMVIAAVGLVAVVSITALLWNGQRSGLLTIGTIAASAFMMQAGIKKLGRKGRMPAQIIGAIGLTSTAAGAYYVATGELDRTAVALWLANWLFAADQIHFVQVRIHSSRAATSGEKMKQGLPFLLSQVGLIGVILAACRFGFLPAAMAVAFVPVLLRGTLWFVRRHRALDVHKLGYSELAQAVIFGALLCVSFFV
jgi:hypothetical protein